MGDYNLSSAIFENTHMLIEVTNVFLKISYMLRSHMPINDQIKFSTFFFIFGAKYGDLKHMVCMIRRGMVAEYNVAHWKEMAQMVRIF